MNIEKSAWEVLNSGRNYMTVEQTRDLSVAVLAISDGNSSKLRTLAGEQDLKNVFLKEVKKLPLSKKTLNSLEDLLGPIIDRLSHSALTDFFMLLAEVLETTPFVELVDEIILRVNQSSKGIITVPRQVTEIVSTYFNMPAGSSLHNATLNLGMDVTDMMELNEDTIFYGQGLDNHSYMIAELRFYIRNIKVHLSYGDVISKPNFIEGNQMKKFDFVYMAPPFGIKINHQQGLAIESDQFGRFDYFGKPSKANLDFGYVISGLNALKDGGKAAFLLPTGALYRAGADQKIRERFIYADIIEAVIELPAGLLAPYTGIGTALVLFNKNKLADRQKKIMLINAEKLSETGPARTMILTEQAMNFINKGLKSNEEITQVSRFVTIENLNDNQILPSHYVFETQMDFEEYGEVKFDLSAFEKMDTKPLKELTKLYRGYNALPRNIEENGPYAVLKIADIEEGEIDYSGLTYYKVEERTKVDNYRIQKNDVILSVRGQNIKVAIFEQDYEDVLLSQNFVGIRCGKDLDPYFLKMYIESPTIQFIISAKLTGSTVMNLPIKEVEELAVPIMPLEKQHEIVATYQDQYKKITEEISILEQQMKKMKLGSYRAMGLDSTFTVSD